MSVFPTMPVSRHFSLLAVAGAVTLISLLSRPAAAQTTNFYTIEYGDPRVRLFDSTLSFVGDATNLKQFGQPYTTNSDLEFDGTYYYTIDGRRQNPDGTTGDPRIRQFDINGNYLGDAASLVDQFGPVTRQIGLAKDSLYYYTIAAGDARVRQFSLAGVFIGDIAVLTDPNGQQNLLQTGIATDGRYFYTVADGDSRVRQFNLNGTFVGDVTNKGLTDGNGRFTSNSGIAVYTTPPVLSVTAPEPSDLALFLPALSLAGIVLRRRRAVGDIGKSTRKAA